MSKYVYKVLVDIVKEKYKENTEMELDDALGKDLDFNKVSLVIESDNLKEVENLRMAITDIKMWELDTNSN